ncbi:MAG: HAMP domain-containing histidine kinase [Clostridiales bacterium]|nr:HAMP domain-containing histidine kinase [Clostridiales bacterium]
MIRNREKHYIWLEKEWKLRLAISTGILAVFFLGMWITGFGEKHPVLLLAGAILLNGLWNYLVYRKEYRNYRKIQKYLEAFEGGNYEYHSGEEFMKAEIRSQIIDQLERMGNAFGVLKGKLTAEKEETKKLATDISHQLKTPVAALQVSMELIQDAETTDEEKEEFLTRSSREIQKLSDLTEALTHLSKLELGMIQLNPKDGSLKETLVRAVNGVFLKANEKQIEIEMEDFQDLILCHDSRWTAEAFSNVIDNAIKYSPPGSRVQIRVEPRISYVIVEIEDQGIGISKEEYPEIFKRFYRGKNRWVEQSEGAGVGLYLVRKILEGQGGSVRAIPALDKGTIFQMMIQKKGYEPVK